MPRSNEVYPQELAQEETRQIETRRRGLGGIPPHAPEVGLALSGGGIRSATFSLGLLQALARTELLRRFDFLSTVSGGGYVGSFLGALFAREEPAGVPAGTPRAAAVEHAITDRTGWLVTWLRDNGRYLSPNGAGDVLIAAAAQLRNWLTIHLVLAFGVLALWLFLDFLRAAVAGAWPGATHGWTWAGIWWSPAFVLPLLTLLLWAVPSGWAYWLVPPARTDRGWSWRDGLAFSTQLALLGVQGWAWLSGFRADAWLGRAQDASLLATLSASLWLVGGALRSWWVVRREAAQPIGAQPPQQPPVAPAEQPSPLPMGARWLTWWATPFALALALALQLALIGRCFTLDPALAATLQIVLTLAPALLALPLLGYKLGWSNDGRVTWHTFAVALPILLAVAALAAWLSSLGGWDARRPALALAALCATVGLLGAAVAFRVRHAIRPRLHHDLSVWLKSGLVVTGALGAVALLDSLGQTAYAAIHSAGGLLGWLAPIPAAVGIVAMFTQKLVTMFGGASARRRIAAPLGAIALAVALLIAGTELVLLSTLGHAIAWHAQPPPAAVTERLFPPDSPPALSLSEDRHIVVSNACDPCEPPAAGAAAMNAYTLFASFVVLLLVSWCFARSRPFMNQSSLAPLYGARLRRAYLGASNAHREKAGRQNPNVTRDVLGDDLDFGAYRPWTKGGPLHLINVTLNETVSGRSQTEQRDRKGLGVAFGPAGVSVGRWHHATWSDAQEGAPHRGKPRALCALAEAGRGAGSFRIFDPEAARDGMFRPEPLSLSRLVAISGAAVSPGLGSRTSLGLALLLGLLNVRLGHWWWSGIDPTRRAGDGAFARIGAWGVIGLRFARLFSVQSHLLDELTARFHGPARRNWYLSDGGHFENTACYELIRRRLPLAVVADDGADPSYAFGDFADLVRKVRLDFGATMRCATAEELDRVLDPAVRPYFGDLAAIRGARGAPRKDGEGVQLSLAHAALVIVTYPGTAERSLLVWIKPSVSQRLDADVLHYALGHPDFPQESTGDQYFDEAQWESYRRLGEAIGERIFGQPSPGRRGWHPRELDPRGAWDALDAGN